MLFTTAVAGRHRKPRTSNTARIVATAGLGTAGIALPLIGATSASAASVSTWDKVASCESGGDWSINTGNGYYGGLQFSASTWAGYGGTSYASTADQASKGQQITIAEKVLASQGPGAWPVCGPRAGLSQGGAPASVDTTSSSKPTAAPTAKPKHSSGSSTTTAHTAKKKTASAPKHAAPAPAVRQAAATHKIGHGDYTVKPGDTLSGIAASAHLSGGWTALYRENRTTVGANPDLIFPGQRLEVG
ncbi:transglycosylase family protein [Streptacidiphilus sp. N1-3]|uniref:Transglycosylase family protein n=1 Tax=Streptacidiphilus alkalitolerans TaxID=3342712 RepID=A0ABV6X2Z6_9ACTN